MAHLAQLGALTDELVAELVPSVEQDNPQRLGALRETSLRGIRNQSFARTNQFSVDDTLWGLEERFRVTGREVLADALTKRLTALEAHTTKWTPEVLHLLLELSDRPALKSRVSDLDLLLEPEEEPGPKLTWKEIAREDGWDEDRALWRTIDYSHSSDEEAYDDTQSDASDRSDGTSVSSPAGYQRTAKDLVTKTDGEPLRERIEESQAWRYAPTSRAADGRLQKTALSEYQILREVLFMLGGLETSLFDSKCNPLPDYQLAGVAWDTHKALISSCAEYGRNLIPLRRFASSKQPVPLLQVFQDCVQKSLCSWDEKVSETQGRFVAIRQDVAVSLINVLAELRPSLGPLCALADIVRQLDREPNAHAFRYLELLFDATGMAQLEGRDTTYELLGTIFFDCFQVYLRPIRLWMEEGKLVPGDRTFFVSESTAKVPLHQIWKSRFKLLQTAGGVLHAPRFLQPAMQRIFTTGKSIVVLKQLGRYESSKEHWTAGEPRMDFAAVRARGGDFAPVAEVFSDAFNVWIESKHHTASATLRKHLFESYGLSGDLDALQSVYLMSDGSMADAFTSAVFRHLDSLSSSWKDRFTLTELAQEAFSPAVDPFRLSAHIDPRGVVHSAITSRASVRVSLPGIRLLYRLKWPVQVVVPEEAIRGYQVIFVFLFQIRRAMFVLGRHRFVKSDAGNIDAEQQAAYHLVRAKLLWFCNNLMTYLASLVLAPNTAEMRHALLHAVDVDEMISVHSKFIDRTISDACLGAKLQPIRECILDILDLTVKLEDAQRVALARRAEEEHEISRLSVMGTPSKTAESKQKSVYVGSRDDDEEDDELDPALEGIMRSGLADDDIPHSHILRDIHADFERHLRFITAGLRGVARASRDEAAGKWDLLAEMLEVGIREQR